MGRATYWIAKAAKAHQSGDLLRATRFLRRATKEEPANLSHWLALGDLEMVQDMFAAAVRSYGRAVSLDPDHGTAHQALATALIACGRTEDAERACRRGLELEPTSDAHVALGVLLHGAGRVEEAEAAFQEALRCDPRSPDALFHAGSVRMWTDPDGAEAFLRRAVKADPEHAAALCALGLLVCRHARWRRAERLLRRAIALGGLGALPHVYLGHVLHGRGHPAEALAAYEEARGVDPGDPHPLFALGDLHRMSGDTDQARQAYEEALRLDPECVDAQYRLGFLLADAGTVDAADRARRHLREAIERAPRHPYEAEAREVLEALA